MLRLKVFVSSVQKELQEERAAIGSLLTTDPFLNQCVVPRIFEKYPAPLRPDPKAYLQLLKTCHIYVLIIGNEYGLVREDGLSATHQEYRLAKERQLPSLICVKSVTDTQREPETDRFFDEIKADNHTYSRFDTVENLQQVVRERLIEYIQTTFDTLPTPLQNDQAKDLFRIAAPFERKHIDHLAWGDLNYDLARQLAALAEEKSPEQLTDEGMLDALQSRGYLWFDMLKNVDRPTIAGSLLLANAPSKALPQARIQMDAFAGTEPDASPLDSVIDDLPLPLIVDRAIAFVRRNTRKPMIIQGSRRVEKDALPPEAIREAVVNAVAHRDYEVSGAKIVLELFADRLVVSSPGLPPGGQSIETIRAGKARSRTRNPLIVQGLTFLGFMEERGSGIRRIREAMTKNGLGEPKFELVGDEFTVTLELSTEGLNETKEGQSSNLSMNERMVLDFVRENGYGTTSLCVERTKLSRGTITGMLKRLVNEGFLTMEGTGRGTRYMVKD
ncbi:MAG TPA: ATP-dependent DNA helicase [Planctomycetaceae bacterium]|nr:ATP-dependent DNA helicase [Planctomycetaceae bacterium]